MPDPKPTRVKEARIAARIEAGKKALRTFQEQNQLQKNNRHLVFTDIPQEVLTHVFLPQRLLEQVADPEKVDVIIYEQTDKLLHAIVVEHTGHDLTNLESLKEYKEIIRRSILHGGEIPPFPRDVDREHWDFAEALEGSEESTQGVVKLSDRILLRVNLMINQADQMEVTSYHDVEKYRGKGVAKEFYNEYLYPFARAIGMRFVTGSNNSENKGFFLQKAGRYLLSDIKPEHQDDFEFEEYAPDRSTIYFLYPEDEDAMVKKSRRTTPMQ